VTVDFPIAIVSKCRIAVADRTKLPVGTMAQAHANAFPVLRVPRQKGSAVMRPRAAFIWRMNGDAAGMKVSVCTHKNVTDRVLHAPTVKLSLMVCHVKTPQRYASRVPAMVQFAPKSA
jgi:hypothetical protein